MKKLLSALLLVLFASVANAQSFNQRATVSATGTGNQTLIAATTGQRISVYGWNLSLAAVVNFKFVCGSTDATGAMQLNAYAMPVTMGGPAYIVCAAGEALIGNLGSSTTIGGIIWYSKQ